MILSALLQVSAIVIDIGADTTKSGYAGEDTPKVVFPSSVGVMKGGEGGSGRQFFVDDLNFRRDTMDVMSPLADGLVSDWDAYSNILEYTLNKRLRVRLTTVGCPLRLDTLEHLRIRSGTRPSSSHCSFFAPNEPVTGGTVLPSSCQVQPSEHPLMIAEPSYNTREIRMKMASRRSGVALHSVALRARVARVSRLVSARLLN